MIDESHISSMMCVHQNAVILFVLQITVLEPPVLTSLWHAPSLWLVVCQQSFNKVPTKNAQLFHFALTGNGNGPHILLPARAVPESTAGEVHRQNMQLQFI
jgi:hypothetical protein